MAETRKKPTREDVEAMKADWLRDPTWDIEDTPGFEGYREELVAFAEEQRQRWEAEAEERRRAFQEEAESLGLHPNALDIIRRLEGRVAALEDR